MPARAPRLPVTIPYHFSISPICGFAFGHVEYTPHPTNLLAFKILKLISNYSTLLSSSPLGNSYRDFLFALDPVWD